MRFKNLIALLLVALFVIGCGSNNSDPVDSTNSGSDNTSGDGTDNVGDTQSSVTLVFSGNDSIELTQNDQQTNIRFRVIDENNAPYTDGNVTILFPDKVQDNIDIGEFTDFSLAVDSQGFVEFTYTGPSNLQQRLNENDTSTRFGFVHTLNKTNVKYFTVYYRPVDGQKELTDYQLKQTASNNQYTMPLEGTRQVSYYVENDKGEKILDENIISINVKLKNEALADIRDVYGTLKDELEFTEKNSVSVSLVSYTKSGLVPIEVVANFIDVNGDEQTITEVFYITILSGPPTAMSISYEGTDHNETSAKFQEHMVITVTDKYFNSVNTQPAVSASMIAGYALENSSDLSTRMYFKTTDTKAGTMSPLSNSLFSTANFNNVDLNNDILLTYTNGYNYNVSGKWDIASKMSDRLVLVDTIEATSSVSDVGFAVGNNYRQDVCRDGQEWVGFVSLESDRLDTNGMLRATINYDYYLTGKDIMLGIELVGYNATSDTTTKFGEVRKHTLRSTGLSSGSCTVPANSTITCRLEVSIDNTAEWYRNARLGSYDVKTSDNVQVVSIEDANDKVLDCSINGGVVYVDATVTEFKGNAGSVSLEGILIGSEF